MAQALTDTTTELSEQALFIAGEIFNLTSEYTDDSHISKFFLTDEIAKVCYGLSAGFTSVIYTPVLNPQKTADSALLSFLYALMTYGFNIYRKERSYRTNAAPYTLPYDKKIIRKAQKMTLDQTTDGELVSTKLADKIILILLDNIKYQMDLTEFKITGHRMKKQKFWDYTKLSLYWGYNFAEQLLEPKAKVKKVSSKTKRTKPH